MKNSILKCALIAVALPLFGGCVERQVVYRDRPVYVQQPAPPPPNAAPNAEVVVDQPTPPPPQVEVIPASPDPAFIWIGGNWEWRNRWVWVGGHWGPRPHPGAVWVRGGWEMHGHRRVWVESHWR
ncbi:MAG TPA: hypothetical protein VGH42_11920 [Verrucomicrobiae bacterium]